MNSPLLNYLLFSAWTLMSFFLGCVVTYRLLNHQSPLPRIPWPDKSVPPVEREQQHQEPL